MEKEKQLRWGVIGVGFITRDFLLAIRRAGLTRHCLVAVASQSSPDQASELAKKFGIERVYTSYDELLASPDIDAVYIGLVHHQHAPVSRAALAAGKAVLCEKPLTTSVEDATNLAELSRKQNVLLVEAVWSAFCPAYARIRQLLTTAEPRSLQVAFTVTFPPRPPRPDSPAIGYNSAMWGIGIYAIHFATVVFGRSPSEIAATGRLDENGVDRGGAVSLRYNNDRLASLLIDTQAGTPENCFAVILCKPGNSDKITSIRVGPRFWMPERIEIVKEDGSQTAQVFPLPGVADEKFANDSFAFPNSAGLAYEADAFADAFNCWKITGKIEHDLRSHQDSINDAKIMEVSLEMMRNSQK